MNILSFLFPELDFHNDHPRIYQHSSIIFIKPDLLYYTVASAPPFAPLHVWEGTPEDPIDSLDMLWFGEPPVVQLAQYVRLSPLAALRSSTAVFDVFSPYPDEPLSFTYEESLLADFDDRPLWQQAKDRSCLAHSSGDNSKPFRDHRDQRFW